MDNRFEGKEVNITVYNNHRLNAEVVLDPYRESRKETYVEMQRKKQRITVEEKSAATTTMRLYKGAGTLFVHVRVGMREISGSVNYFDGSDIILYISKHRGNVITSVPNHDSKMVKHITKKLGYTLAEDAVVYNVPLGRESEEESTSEDETISEDDFSDDNPPDEESSSNSVLKWGIISIMIFLLVLFIILIVYVVIAAIMHYAKK